MVVVVGCVAGKNEERWLKGVGVLPGVIKTSKTDAQFCEHTKKPVNCTLSMDEIYGM